MPPTFVHSPPKQMKSFSVNNRNDAFSVTVSSNASFTPFTTPPRSPTMKLKNGQEVDVDKLKKVKTMMIGRAKSINGDKNNIYFPPVS